MEREASENGEEEYIEMEVSSPSSPSFSAGIQNCCSSPQSREFEFQMCSTTSTHTPSATSPADHLFHKGKLLPLYLLHPTTTAQDYYHLPFTAPSTNTANTPLDSSPPESRRVSCDQNSDDYFFEWSKDLNTFTTTAAATTTKISTWPKKLNIIKKSILSHKLRASKAYLKSLFVKSAKQEISDKAKPLGVSETAPYPTIAAIINSIEKESAEENNNVINHNINVQRRSFSSAIKRHSPTKCLSSSSSNSSSGSSSFSLNSNGGLHELHCLRRSSSAKEIEGSIEAAIAHCKKSQQNGFD